ncbi:Mitotic exit network component [Savitreella phatthalungensis]
MMTTFLKGRTTFKPNNRAEAGTKLFQLRQYAEAILGSGDLRTTVKLPEGEDREEWMACLVVDFMNQLKMLWAPLSDFVTPERYPSMRAGPGVEYLWQDDVKYRRATALPAKEYVENVFSWLQENIDDENKFPSELGVPFARGFDGLVKTMCKRMFRIYAHMYTEHFAIVAALGIEAHLNTSFKQFVFFVREFDLVDDREFSPVRELIDGVMAS